MVEYGMKPIPYGQFSAEMRSGKIISLDENFTSLLGYTSQDIKEGLLFKDMVQDVEYRELISDLRERFVLADRACYMHDMVARDGKIIRVCAFIEIQNKLLNGHRVMVIGIADISQE